jgi:hypothetical protein
MMPVSTPAASYSIPTKIGVNDAGNVSGIKLPSLIQLVSLISATVN